MLTYGELEARLGETRALIRPGRTLEATSRGVVMGERREFLKLGSRLTSMLSRLDALLEESDPDAPVEPPLKLLFAKLEDFSSTLQQGPSARLRSGDMRDLIYATGRAIHYSEEPTFRGGTFTLDRPTFSPGRSFRAEPRRLERSAAPERSPQPESPASAAAPSAARARRRQPRYANAALVEPAGKERLDRGSAIPCKKVFRLRLDIGKLSRESQVEAPEPFPDDVLPDEDVWIDVMVSSTDFGVGESEAALGRSRVAHGRFLLPKEGGAALAPDGGRYLFFFLRAPGEARRGARARVGYYFREAVVQSQVLVADVGTSPGGFQISTDFTVAERPEYLGAIRERPRISVFTNHNGTGHQVSIRTRGAEGAPTGDGLELNQGKADLVDKLRGILRREEVAPTQRRRSRNQLIADLRALAGDGWRLWDAVVAPNLDLWDELHKDPEHTVLQVARSRASSFTFPWSLIYEYSLDSDKPVNQLPICPLVDKWDGKTPLFEGFPRECPEAAHVDHSDLLCPFGFWGFRYSVEQITSSDKPVKDIVVTKTPVLVSGETQYDVKKETLDQHVLDLAALLKEAFPGLELHRGTDKKKLHDALGADLSLVYFYCHGERAQGPGSDTYLGIGNRQKLTTGDFSGWIRQWRLQDRRIWDAVRPLIFINACHSLEITPTTLVSYLEAFVGTAHAAGVIGTEVKVHQVLAMDFALSFFRYFRQKDCSVDHALRQVRLDFLRDGNLLGLVYTPYCWADLTLRPTA